MMNEEDQESLAAAVELTLELLDTAERHRSFPDDANEREKREAIKRERRRYKELRARLVTDEDHGVPVAREFLEQTLRVTPTEIPDDESDERFAAWFDEQHQGSDLDQ